MIGWCDGAGSPSSAGGVLLVWSIVGQGHTALTVVAGGGCLDIHYLAYHFSLLSPGDGPI